MKIVHFGKSSLFFRVLFSEVTVQYPPSLSRLCQSIYTVNNLYFAVRANTLLKTLELIKISLCILSVIQTYPWLKRGNEPFSWGILMGKRQDHSVRAYSRLEYMIVHDKFSFLFPIRLTIYCPLQLDEIKTLTEPFKWNTA